MYNIKLGMMLVAIADLDIEAFKLAYEEIKAMDAVSATPSISTSQRIFDELKRSIEELRNISFAKKEIFVNACIDHIDLLVNEKKFYKAYALLNLPGIDAKQREEMVIKIKKIAPAKYKKEILMQELGFANSTRDIERIKTLIQEINNLK